MLYVTPVYRLRISSNECGLQKGITRLWFHLHTQFILLRDFENDVPARIGSTHSESTFSLPV